MSRSVAALPADLAACLTAPRRTVATPRGPVEYAERGEGRPLLALHGTPGGCDQGLLLGERLRAGGFRVVAPSRPGYLGTPLATGPDFTSQADAMVALLDDLEIDRAAVAAVSGGGPTAYLLAARHPDRVTCLLQIDAISGRDVEDHPAMQRLTWSRAGVAVMLWLLDHRPGPLLRTVFGSAAAAGPLSEAELVGGFRALTLSGAGWPDRRDGYRNDIPPVRGSRGTPAGRDRVPGDEDQGVVPEHAERAHARIRGSVLQWIPGGAHLGFYVSPVAQAAALAWLTASTN